MTWTHPLGQVGEGHTPISFMNYPGSFFWEASIDAQLFRFRFLPFEGISSQSDGDVSYQVWKFSSRGIIERVIKLPGRYYCEAWRKYLFQVPDSILLLGLLECPYRVVTFTFAVFVLLYRILGYLGISSAFNLLLS